MCRQYISLCLLIFSIDCISSDKDPEAAGCSGFDGYCMNNPNWKSSIGCSGKCVEKLEAGGDCSKAAVNIHKADPTHLTSSGDGNACKSGKCICGICTSTSSSKLALEKR
jgi:hypothetical protein